MCFIQLTTYNKKTSITIDDVKVVIDSGRMKEKTHDPHLKLTFLKAGWVSQVGAVLPPLPPPFS